MPKTQAKYSTQVNVKMSPEMKAMLAKIAAKQNGRDPVDLLRDAAHAIIEHYIYFEWVPRDMAIMQHPGPKVMEKIVEDLKGTYGTPAHPKTWPPGDRSGV